MKIFLAVARLTIFCSLAITASMAAGQAPLAPDVNNSGHDTQTSPGYCLGEPCLYDPGNFDPPTAHAATQPVSVGGFQNVNAPGAMETDPYAVNSSGVIAGDFVDKAGIQHGMILRGKKLTSVNRKNCTTTPGATAIAFYGINSKNVVVGWCLDAVTDVDDAFSYAGGKFVSISPPGATSTQAHGINSKGEIVGTYIDSSNLMHGFLLNGSVYTTLDVPGETSADAWGINNKGLITLFALNKSGNYDSFVFNGMKYKKVDVPKETQSFVAGINDFGDRIYTVLDSSNQSHGAFFLNISGGGYTVFDDPSGINMTQAFGLNDKLEIVGRYALARGKRPSSVPTQGYSAIGCCRGIPPNSVRNR